MKRVRSCTSWVTPEGSPTCRADSAHPASGACGATQRGLDLRPGHVVCAAAARLPDRRCAEGRYHGSLCLSALAPGDHRPVLEGGQLLRPSLPARGVVVPRSLSDSRRRSSRRRGEPGLPVPPACARASASDSSRGKADHAAPGPSRQGALALPPRGRAGPRTPLVRRGDRSGARADARRGAAARARARLLQPPVVGLHVPRARPLRGAARALVGRVSP